MFCYDIRNKNDGYFLSVYGDYSAFHPSFFVNHATAHERFLAAYKFDKGAVPRDAVLVWRLKCAEY